MLIIDKTTAFVKWFNKLRDRRTKSIILDHIDRMEEGKMGDTKSVGSGVFEKKINYGAGYRLYYFQKGKSWIILLCGGDKGTQQADIAQAKQLKKELE